MTEQMIAAVLPSLLVSVAMAFFGRAQKRRDRAAAAHTQARKTEGLLALELQMATAKLAYATAMALKRGRPNGEVEDGVAAYEVAKKKYTDFLNEQATDHLNP